MSQAMDLRLPDATVARLQSRARRIGTSPHTLAQRYVEEGLRMDEHPLIRFADGPAGQRPHLVGGGMDVWDVIVVVRDNDGDVHATTDSLEMAPELIQAAVAYYHDYPDEVDAWIEANEREAEEAYAAWLAKQPDHVKREERRRILSEMTAETQEAGMHEMAATPQRTR